MSILNTIGSTVRGAYDTLTGKVNDPNNSTYNYKAPTYSGPTLPNTNESLYRSTGVTAPANPALNNMGSNESYITDLNSKIAALQQQLTPTLPSMNLTSMYNTAKMEAETKDVNPYFTLQLNSFLGRQNELRKRTQEDYSTQLTSLQDELKSFLEGTQTDRTRTSEDTATTIGNTLADSITNRTAEGRQFDIANQSNKEQLADTGLTYSGLGKQQLYNVAQTRAETGEKAQKEVERTVKTQELLKTRTFEDLAKADTQMNFKTEKDREEAKRTLDRSMNDILFDETQGIDKLENERQLDIIRATEERQRIAMQNYIAGLSTPAQKEYANKIYGSYL